MQNAEKARRKAKTRKLSVSEPKQRVQKNRLQLSARLEEEDSENTESASETESASGGESESESTITDSSPEDSSASQPPQKVRGKKVTQNTSITTSASRKTSEDALELFISAAEALNNIVPPEIALHDHSYSLPPRSLMSGVDLQGSSGLSLIAAAAAVVSPSLSRSAGSGKLPGLSPVRAPRGRPPNSQRRGGGGSASKLSPTLLSPAGSSSYVPLTDVKPVTFRGRARSAPTDRPRSATITVPRPPSNLSRISLNNSNKVRGVLPTTSLQARSRDPSSPSASSLSLKSMIASQPQQASTSTAGGSVTAFEALVNVAVAAPPAELHTPRTSATAMVRTGTGPPTVSRQNSRGGRGGSVGSRSTPATPTAVPSQHHPQLQVHAQPKDGSTANNILDAINMLALASLTQPPQSTSSSQSTVPVLSAQPLLVQAPVIPTSNLLGTIMTQTSTPTQVGSNSTSASDRDKPTHTVSSAAVSSSVTASVNSLLEHLTGSVGIGGPTGSVGTVSPVSTASTTASRSSTLTTENRLSPVITTTANSQLVPTLPKTDEVSGTVQPQKLGLKDSAPTVPLQAPQGTSSDELSNLNLLSTLVAVLTPSSSSSSPQPKAPPPFVASAVTTTVSKAAPSVPKTITATSKFTSSHHHTSFGTENPPTIKERALNEGLTVSETAKPSTSSDNVPKKTVDGEVSLLKSRGGTKAQGVESPEREVDNLPRSVVRANPQAHHHHSTVANDITSSLSAIIPPSSMSTYPSMSQQSTVLLYTRSLSFPLSTSKEPSPEEEDHLESATRGISELSKLLGTTESINTSGGTRENSVDFKATWKAPELGFGGSRVASSCSSTQLVHSHGSGAGGTGSGKALGPVFSSRTEVSSEGTKPFLSSLLESHGTVHKTAPAIGTTLPESTNSNSNNDISVVDLERHSR